MWAASYLPTFFGATGGAFLARASSARIKKKQAKNISLKSVILKSVIAGKCENNDKSCEIAPACTHKEFSSQPKNQNTFDFLPFFFGQVGHHKHRRG